MQAVKKAPHVIGNRQRVRYRWRRRMTITCVSNCFSLFLLPSSQIIFWQVWGLGCIAASNCTEFTSVCSFYRPTEFKSLLWCLCVSTNKNQILIEMKYIGNMDTPDTVRFYIPVIWCFSCMLWWFDISSDMILSLYAVRCFSLVFGCPLCTLLAACCAHLDLSLPLPFQCAEELEHALAKPEQKVIWYLVTDVLDLRPSLKGAVACCLVCWSVC
jgi:hypothetical protein